MSTLTVKISGSAVQITEGSLTIKSRVDDKDTAVFQVRDDTGTLAFNKGQPVLITDSVQGTLFSGFLNKPTMINLYPNATNMWSCDCVDQFYVPAKRVHKRRHKGQHAAPIVALQVQQYLEPDGVSGNFGLDWSELQPEWAAGTLAGVTAATNFTTGNVGAGNLELSSGGTPYTYSNTLSTGSSGNILTMTGYASSGYSTAYTYRQIWAGSLTIVATSDFFQYDVWVNGSSPAIAAGCDFVCSDGTYFSASAAVDAQGLAANPKTDISGLATNTWYTRSFNIPGALVGKTIVSVLVGLAGTNAGAYTAYFRNIFYTVASPFATTTFFDLNSTLTTNVQAHNIGYTNVSLVQATGEDKVFVSEVSPGSFSVVNLVQTSQIIWTTSNLPAGVNALVETSIDAAATWQTATSGAAIPNLLPGMVAGTGFNNPYLNIRCTFTLGSDPTVTASIPFTVTINPAYSATKSDVTKTYQITSDFNTGTYTNLVSPGITGSGITLNGFQRNWDNASIINQTLFGSGTASVINKQFNVQCAAAAVATSRLDFAGTWANFTAEVDITVISSTVRSSFTYRTTGWQNTDGTFAYSVDVRTTTLELFHGTNSSSGGGSTTTLGTASINLTANSIHRLKVVASGSSHHIYIDSVLLLSVTDGTYTAAGNFGLRNSNGSGATANVLFDNFGVAAALSGTWQSSAIAISGATTYGNSLVQWDTDNLPDNTTSISVQTSVDGGSTFQSVSNGGAITGLTAGQSLSAKTLILLVTLAANNAPVVPSMAGISVWILGQYTSTGSRTNAPLAWDSVQRLNVASGWSNASNGNAYTQAGTGTTAVAGNEATIANTTGDVHMSLANSIGNDEDGTVRFQLSASTITAGLELRYSNANTFYRLQASTTTISIVKAGGPMVTLATVSMALSINTFYRMHFRVTGSGVGGHVSLNGSVWLDGTTEPTAFVISATD